MHPNTSTGPSTNGVATNVSSLSLYWTQYSRGQRGMSKWRDILDWVGGLPYEVATPEQIFDFYRARGFKLTKLHAGNVGIGCNEFVFIRES